jgi:o-succinylbenzoate---CoA ligase
METLRKAESDIYQTYGMTETLSHIALQKISNADADVAFKALPGVKLSLDERNCLVIETDYLTEAIITNDIVEMLDAHAFVWLGRADNVINSGGIKLYPEKIEKTVAHVFTSLAVNKLFFISGLPDAKLGSQVTLIIESQDKIDETALLQELLKQLLKHEVPKTIMYAAAFEMTPTGKINRNATLLKLLSDD